jgi:opacity protein-like surface antigen
MRSKLAISALVVASLFGATAIASAQTQTPQSAPGASGEGNAGTTTMAPGKMKSSNKKQGTTTGMAPEGMKPGSVDESKPGGRSTARTPPGN